MGTVPDLVGADSTALTGVTVVAVLFVAAAVGDEAAGLTEDVVGLDMVAEMVAVGVVVVGAAAVVGRAEAAGMFVTTVVLGTETVFTVEVAAGVRFNVVATVVAAVVIVVEGADIGTVLTVVTEDGAGHGLEGVVGADVATVVVLTGSGTAVFTVAGAIGLEAVETVSVGFGDGTAVGTVVVGGAGAVVVCVSGIGTGAGMGRGMESAKETWADGVAGHGTVAGVELMTCAGVDVETTAGSMEADVFALLDG